MSDDTMKPSWMDRELPEDKTNDLHRLSAEQISSQPLTYEQEVHALLHAAASNTESLLEYFEAQAANESGDAKKLTLKCIDWKKEDLRRMRELIPQALQRREACPSDAQVLMKHEAGPLRHDWKFLADTTAKCLRCGLHVPAASAPFHLHNCAAKPESPAIELPHAGHAKPVIPSPYSHTREHDPLTEDATNDPEGD